MKAFSGMVLLLASVVVAAWPDACIAQEDGDQVVAAYAEMFGNTAVASVNMDILSERGFLFRIGVRPLLDHDSAGSNGTWRDGVEGLVVVSMVGLAAGEGSGRFETGLGATFGSKSATLDEMDVSLPALTATLGYRYQPPDRPLMLRVGFTPLVTKDRFVGRFGFSIGWTLDASKW